MWDSEGHPERSGLLYQGAIRGQCGSDSSPSHQICRITALSASASSVDTSSAVASSLEGPGAATCMRTPNHLRSKSSRGTRQSARCRYFACAELLSLRDLKVSVVTLAAMQEARRRALHRPAANWRVDRHLVSVEAGAGGERRRDCDRGAGIVGGGRCVRPFGLCPPRVAQEPESLVSQSPATDFELETEPGTWNCDADRCSVSGSSTGPRSSRNCAGPRRRKNLRRRSAPALQQHRARRAPIPHRLTAP